MAKYNGEVIPLTSKKIAETVDVKYTKVLASTNIGKVIAFDKFHKKDK